MDYHQSTKIIFLPAIYHVFPLYNKEIRKFHLITSSQVIAAAFTINIFDNLNYIFKMLYGETIGN